MNAGQSSEWRQPEWVATILYPEDAEQEAVHAEHDTSPDNDHDTLQLRVLGSRNLESERDGCKSKDTVFV